MADHNAMKYVVIAWDENLRHAHPLDAHGRRLASWTEAERLDRHEAERRAAKFDALVIPASLIDNAE